MTNIQIAACILTYDGGDRVIATLESAKLQTYLYKDLVIADDASTDSGYTVSIIDEWLEKNGECFTNVQFIKNPQNLGIVANLKNAALHAKGEIIFPLGQGDMCYGPDTFTQIAEEISKQRQNGLEDPYFWLGQYMGFTIKDDIFKPIQLYKDLPHQHKLLSTNPYKALKINLRKWEIGGVGIVYNTNYFKEGIFPLNKAPRNWEDGPAFLWALIEGHRIGTLPIMIRWYEVGTGISWEINRKTRIAKMRRIYNRVFDKLKYNYVNPNSKSNKTLIYWFASLSPVDKKIGSIKNNYLTYLKRDEMHLNFNQLLIFTLTKTCGLFMARLRRYQSIIIHKLQNKKTVKNNPFPEKFFH